VVEIHAWQRRELPKYERSEHAIKPQFLCEEPRV
jgi:hypothetical protein